MQKCGAFGLQDHDPKLARLLKRMVKLSAIASGNFNEYRRRYGAFILTVRDNTLVDINTEDDAVICITCLGTTILPDGEDCSCIDSDSMV
jgi:hypothetical protein